MAANKRVSPARKTTKVKVDSNVLTLNSLIQDDSQYDELHTVTFQDGRYTQVYKKFRTTKIDTLLEQFGVFVQEYSSKIGEMKEEKILDYVSLHVLIFFSTLSPTGLPEKFEQRVLLFEKLLDSKLAETVFEAFDPEQVSLVFERMNKKLDTYVEILNKDKETRDKVIEYVEKSDMKNKDIILETIFNKSVQDETGVDEESGETV